ncbi:MAG: MOSC domain-containing protein [Candidatus Aminicenantes bacterium]|nr:MOSC domain-containing protein [Candidatus Aminicenantes bacterium]
MKKTKIEFKIESVNISDKKGVQKHRVEEVELVEDFGIKGDAHAGKWHRQVSFLAGEGVDKMKEKGLELQPGAFGENIVTRGIDWSQVKVGGKVFIKDLILEVTQIGKECHDRCAIYYAAGECIMPKQGIFVKVLKGGRIHAEDSGYYSI